MKLNPPVIELIDNKTAKRFTKDNSNETLEGVGKKRVNYGLFQDSELKVVAIFCNPRTRIMQREFTTELFRVVCKTGFNVETGLRLILKHYMSLSSSVDMFAYSDVFNDTSNVETLLMRGACNDETIFTWHNPVVRFYVYELSSVDGRYYYGRHKTLLETIPEMLNDGYMGSGGIKFKNWVNSVGSENIVKEILAVCDTWRESVIVEETLIGDRYKTDPKCKNSKPGGTGLGAYMPEYVMAICPIHGESKHRGACHKCSVEKSRSIKECLIHGSTMYYGDSCYKCASAGNWVMKYCQKHGLSKHNGDSCQKCVSNNSIVLKECQFHGLVKHSGSKCMTCNSINSVSVRHCEIHGEVKHIGDKCKKCIAIKSISLKMCKLHGEAKFVGDKCSKCSASKSWSIKYCEQHGESKHRGNNCEKCAQKVHALQAKGNEVTGNCLKHGETVFFKGSCKKCAREGQITFKDCSIHGLVKFNGEKCVKCVVSKIWTVQECTVHGESKHRSGKCESCARLKQWEARKRLPPV